MSAMTELKDQLSLLGRKTEYKQDYAPEVLEAFDNKHPENDYWVRFNCPEFTSLCPITGQPDFAEHSFAIQQAHDESYSIFLASEFFYLYYSRFIKRCSAICSNFVPGRP